MVGYEMIRRINTERLRLRNWTESDRDNFVALTSDPIVMADQGGPLSRTDSDSKLDRYRNAIDQQGYGRWLLETQGGEFLGYCGVMPPRDDHPLAPHNEIGWRLKHAAWGKGYATEAAVAALTDAFRRVELREVYSYTGPDNLRSQAVMERLKLQRQPSLDFTLHDNHIGLWQGLVWRADSGWLTRFI